MWVWSGKNLFQLFAPKLDLEELKLNSCAFEVINKGGELGGTIGLMDRPGRFSWMTAAQSTILQPSNVHPGFTADAAETLNRLFDQLLKTSILRGTAARISLFQKFEMNEKQFTEQV